MIEFKEQIAKLKRLILEEIKDECKQKNALELIKNIDNKTKQINQEKIEWQSAVKQFILHYADREEALLNIAEFYFNNHYYEPIRKEEEYYLMNKSKRKDIDEELYKSFTKVINMIDVRGEE